VTGHELLAGALLYALRTVPLVTGELLTAPTPCRDWDVRQLLLHACDSVAAVAEGLHTGRVGLDPGRSRPGRRRRPAGAVLAARADTGHSERGVTSWPRSSAGCRGQSSAPSNI
jgi:Mycothiol maleylpyruvate isomerase N-terminal domain